MSRTSLPRILTAGAALLLSAAVAGPVVAGSGDTKLRSLKRADFISLDEVKAAPGGYKLQVKGRGEVLIQDIRTARPGEKCLVHKQTLAKLVRKSPPGAAGQKTFVVNRIDIDPSLGLGDHICIGEGKGCDVIVLDTGGTSD